MTGIIDNNEGINEFYMLIGTDLLTTWGKLHFRLNFWSLKTITFVFEIMQEVKILHYFFCRADKIRQF